MDSLFGSKPKVFNQNPDMQSAISPAQQQLQQLLVGQLQQFLPQSFQNVESGAPAIPAAYGGQFAAPLSPEEGGFMAQIGNAVQPGGAAQAPLNSAQSALTQILSGQPQDFSQYFHDAIATPLENTFEQRTLPALKGAFARSAGGTNSVGANTGYSAAVGHAASDLGAQLQAAMTSLGTTAETNAQQHQVQGVGLAPGISQQILSNLGTGLTTAGLPRQIQQTQIAGQQGQAGQALQFLTSLFGQGGGISSSPTLVPGNVVNQPGNSGLIGSAIPGLSSGLGMGLAAMMMSDPRVKDIVEEEANPALATIRKLTVKKAKYKWEGKGKERPMLMADNVEAIHPAAAARVAGIGMVKPHEMIALLVKGMQELDKAA